MHIRALGQQSWGGGGGYGALILQGRRLRPRRAITSLLELWLRQRP